MSVRIGWIVVAAVLTVAPAAAQPDLQSAPPASMTAGTPATSASFARVLSDTARDFTELSSPDSARWLAIGAAAALLARTEDARVGRVLARPNLSDAFGSGQLIGSSPFQMGGALAAYTIGRLTGSPRTVQIAADVFRAQAVAQVTTYAMKYSILRVRPDGSRFSFPSGHTSVTFAAATVLQSNLGWKAGLPAYGVAAYVAASRLQTRRHHLSDVIFGAALGITAGRSISIGRGKSRLAVAPLAVPGGSGIALSLVR